MEDDQQSHRSGIGEDAFIKPHHVLLVAAEKVHLDTADADTLHPCHLGKAASFTSMHEGRLGSIVPYTVGVVPQINAYALLLAVGGKFSHFFAANPFVPPGINQHRLIPHVGCKVDIPFLFVKITAGVHSDNPTPRAPSI